MTIIIEKKFKKKRTHKILAHTAREKLYDSTIHGIGQFFRAEHTIIKIMWICFGLGALGYLIYLITTSIIEYNKHEVRVEISRKFDLPATFPAVTICNINPFNEAYAYSYIIKKTKDAECFKLKNGTEFTKCINSTDANTSFDKFVEKMKRIIANDKTLTAFDYYWYGFDLETDMMISCSFNGIPCSAHNFSIY